MTIARINCTFLGASLLPEDRYVNTFHIDTGASSLASGADAIRDLIAFFYNGVATNGQVGDIASRMSPYITTVVTLNMYDLAQPEPRVPIVRTFNLDARAAAGEPEECAAVLSYRAALPNTPRRRGRIYIGPLGTTAITAIGTTTPGRIGTGLQSDLPRAGSNLQVGLGLIAMEWVVLSVASGGQTHPLVSWHCDNAIDTQRRRGAAATARQTFP